MFGRWRPLPLIDPIRVVPGSIVREEVRILDEQRVEAAEQLVVLHHVVIGPHVRQLARFRQIPMIEIETAAGDPERLAGNREGRSDCRMNQFRRRRVDARTAFAPVTRLASFKKSKNRKVALRDRRHRDRGPERPGHCHGGHQQTPPPRPSESHIPVLHRHPQAGALVVTSNSSPDYSSPGKRQTLVPRSRARKPTNAA